MDGLEIEKKVSSSSQGLGLVFSQDCKEEEWRKDGMITPGWEGSMGWLLQDEIGCWMRLLLKYEEGWDDYFKMRKDGWLLQDEEVGWDDYSRMRKDVWLLQDEVGWGRMLDGMITPGWGRMDDYSKMR